MSVQFANGQEIRLHLPGGVFQATIVSAGPGDKEWIIHVPDDNPVKKINGRNDGEFEE